VVNLALSACVIEGDD